MRKLGSIILVALTALCFAFPGFAQTPSTTPLYLFTTGSGQISPFVNGELLTVGQTYEMQAMPDPGSVFSGWQPINIFTFTEFTVDPEGNPLPPITSTVLSPEPVSSEDSVLDFTMQPLMVISDTPARMVTESFGWQANFVPAPEPSTLAVLMVGGLMGAVLVQRIRFRRVSRQARRLAPLTPPAALLHSPAMNQRQRFPFAPSHLLYLALFLFSFPAPPTSPIGKNSVSSVVHRYGRLQVKAGQLCDQSGQPVQLRGMSTHDPKLFPFAPGTLGNLVDHWHVSVVRAAMYTDSYGSSYIREPAVKQTVKLIVDSALRSDIYVIIDWHILVDGNPNQYKQQAKEFFEEMAATYRGHPNIIYEICN